MSTKRKPTPSYLHHKQSGRGRAVWTDTAGIRQQKLLPGAYDSEESRTAFARLQLELAASPHQATEADQRAAAEHMWTPGDLDIAHVTDLATGFQAILRRALAALGWESGGLLRIDCPPPF